MSRRLRVSSASRISESAYDAESTLVNRFVKALDRCVAGGDSGEAAGEGVLVEA